MGELFLSEARSIHNCLRRHNVVANSGHLEVVSEVLAPSRTNTITRFNCDFSLYLSSPDKWGCIKSFGEKVLPNSAGVDLFVTIDKVTARPLFVELLGGEAFPIRYFQKYIEKVEYLLSQIARPITFRRAGFCRVLVIDYDICFLVFPNHSSPLRGRSAEVIWEDDDACVKCASEGKDILYIDGWMKTRVDLTAWKVEAVSISPS